MSLYAHRMERKIDELDSATKTWGHFGSLEGPKEGGAEMR